MATGREISTTGQVSGVCHAIAELMAELLAVTCEADMESDRWRWEVLGRLRSLRAVIAVEGRLAAAAGYAAERSELHAALADLDRASAVGATAIEKGALPVYLLAMNRGAPAAMHRLARALQALTARTIERDGRTQGFAC